MNDNEIVLNLLDFYKRKGVDLHKVLDDHTFKSLSRDSQLQAIKMYAERILAGTSQNFGKNDFKKMLKDMLVFGAMGAVAGGFSSLGVAKTFHNGKVPLQAIINGGVIGAVGAGATKLLDTVGRLKDRSMIVDELHHVVQNPTSGNALNVLTANHLRNDADLKGKLLSKIRGRLDTNMNKQTEEMTEGLTSRYNEHVLKNPKIV